MMSDDQLAITCIADEAGNQPHEGKVAVGLVILNRLHMPYASDGTIVGTVLHKWAFSGFWARMENGHYTQTEFDLAGAEQQAQSLFDVFSREPIWDACDLAWKDAQAHYDGKPMSFTPGPAFAHLNPKTVLYYNPAACARPAWAVPGKLAATIFQHVFYNA